MRQAAEESANKSKQESKSQEKQQETWPNESYMDDELLSRGRESFREAIQFAERSHDEGDVSQQDLQTGKRQGYHGDKRPENFQERQTHSNAWKGQEDIRDKSYAELKQERESRREKVIGDDEPGVISRIADKVVDYTEKIVGRPIVKNQKAKKAGAIKEEQPDVVSRMADKVVGMTERMVGRPVVQNENIEYEKAPKETLRAEIKEEESKREEALEKAKQQEGKDMLDLESENHWETIINSDKPIVVDFYKQDCVNCRRLYPKLMDKFKDSKDKWMLVGANMERVAELGRQMSVDHVPTVVVFHKGKKVEEFRELKDDVDIESMMNRIHELNVK